MLTVVITDARGRWELFDCATQLLSMLRPGETGRLVAIGDFHEAEVKARLPGWDVIAIPGHHPQKLDMVVLDNDVLLADVYPE